MIFLVYNLCVLIILFFSQTSFIQAQSPQPPCPLPGDTNSCDGIVNIIDFAYISSKFGTSDPKADVKPDGIINIFDFTVFSTNFGNVSNSPIPTQSITITPTPNPTSTAPSPTGIHSHLPGESMAMSAWSHTGKNKPNQLYDKCDDGTDIITAHNAYHVIAYDGLKYPTWHPPVVNNPITQVGKCAFGHEHGSDPQKYIHWNEIIQHFGKDINSDGVITPLVIGSNGQITPGDRAGIPFGIANEHMDQYYNQEGRDSVFVRHEDHVGHKIEQVSYESEMIGNTTHPMAQIPGTSGINIPYYQSGSNTFQPTGVTCSHLHKFHQGTHSTDALLNNMHEVIFHSTCTSVNVNNINAPTYYPNNKIILTGMMSFGKPGIYKRFCGRKRNDNICGLTGTNLSTTPGSSCILTDPLLSRLPNAINSNSLGRNMTDKWCLEHVDDPGYGISEGSPYFTPYEIWEGDFAIYTGNILTDSSMIAEHGRQWDVLDPVRIIDVGYQHPTRTWQKDFQFTSEICETLLRKPGTNISRTIGCNNGNQIWDSPQSNFKGLKRTTYFGRNRISNGGGVQTWWTDPLGGNATTNNNQPSLLKQYISSTEADIQRVQSRIQQIIGNNNFLNDRAIQRQFNNGNNTVHVPN